jgi:hypothetical protein
MQRRAYGELLDKPLNPRSTPAPGRDRWTRRGQNKGHHRNDSQFGVNIDGTGCAWEGGTMEPKHP